MKHTCITDDGGTPNRKCYACIEEEQMKCEKHPQWISGACPYCRERTALEKTILQDQLLDLITLMPDSQTQQIIDYIYELRETRRKARRVNGEEIKWEDEEK